MTLQVGKLIQHLRKQQGMTQQMLGAGIASKTVVSRIENGLVEPNLFTLNALFVRLGKSLEPFEIMISNRDLELLKKGEYDSSLRTTVVAEAEFLKDIRKAKGMSQEQLSSDICARETISNIENGRVPRHKKIQNLMEQLGQSCGRYYGYVIAQDYEVYELVEKYQQQRDSHSKETRKLLQEIKRKINTTLPVNRQFLESSELMEKRKDGVVTPGEEMAALEKCLRYTMPEYDGDIYRIPYRQEVIILKEIIKCLEDCERKEQAKYLAQKVAQKNGKKVKIS